MYHEWAVVQEQPWNKAKERRTSTKKHLWFRSDTARWWMCRTNHPLGLAFELWICNQWQPLILVINVLSTAAFFHCSQVRHNQILSKPMCHTVINFSAASSATPRHWQEVLWCSDYSKAVRESVNCTFRHKVSPWDKDALVCCSDCQNAIERGNRLFRLRPRSFYLFIHLVGKTNVWNWNMKQPQLFSRN